MAPAPGGGPGGASAGPGRKGTPPGPRSGPAGHGPQGSGAGSGDAGGAAGTGAAGPWGVRGAGRWARGARPLPAARAAIAHPAIPRPRLPRSPAREAGGAEPGAGPACERPRAGLGLRAPLRRPGRHPQPQPRGHVAVDAHPWHVPPPPAHHITQRTDNHTWSTRTGTHTPTLHTTPHPPAPSRTELLSAKHLSLSQGADTPGLNPEQSPERGLNEGAGRDSGQARWGTISGARRLGLWRPPNFTSWMCACVGFGAAHQVLADGRLPRSLPEPCWARGDRPQKHKQAALLASGSGSRTFSSNPRTHSPSQDPCAAQQAQGSRSIPQPQGSSHHRPHSVTTTSLQKPSAHPSASGNLLFFFLSFPSFPKWLFLAKCLT